MSVHNGTTNVQPKESLSVEEMKEKAKQLRIANIFHERKLKAKELEIRESLWNMWDTNYPGSPDLWEPIWSAQTQAGPISPIASPSDRSRGMRWPLIRNDTDINRYIQTSRILTGGTNSFAGGLLTNLVNAVIGKSFTYKVGGRDTEEARDFSGPFIEPQEGGPFPETPLDQLCKGVDSWLRSFFAANNWTISMLPEDEPEEGRGTLAGGETKEREMCRRTIRDGNGFLRLFYNDNGTVDVRFVGAECVWGAPDGKTAEDGWSFGIQTKVHKFWNEELNREEVHTDREEVLNYYVRKTEATDQGNASGGDIVPAWQMIHVKIMGEDSEVKMGMPAFCLGVADRLMQASKINSLWGQTAAVNAATAEVWKHQIGTKEQIASLQNPGARTVYPADMLGDPMTIYPTRGGQVRRTPNSQEPVNYPTGKPGGEIEMSIQALLREAGTAFSAPENVVSGDASNNNLASLQEAGTPWVTAREADQEHFKSPYLKLCWRVIRHAVKCQRLPEQALRLCEVTIEAPTVHKDNKGEMAQVMSQELRAGVTSHPAEIGKRGHDWRKIVAEENEYKRMTGGGQQEQGMPGQGGEEVQQVGQDGEINPAVDPKRSLAAKQAARARGLNVVESAEVWYDVPDDVLLACGIPADVLESIR